MYKVLLVDDEPLDLTGLRKLAPWEQFDMEVASAVFSGFAALDFLNREHVDILITDIKMPIMTGIELAAKAREQFPALKIVFVSGYEDFQYARKAIQMNANAYILKPVNDKELFETLRQVKEQLEESRVRKQQEKQYQQGVSLVKNEIFLKWLQGIADHDSAQLILEQEDHIEAGKCAFVSVIELDDVSWKLKKNTETERQEIIKAVLKCITDYIEAQQLGKFALVDRQKLVLFTNQTDAVPIEKLQALIEHSKANTPLTVTIGVGQTVEKLELLPLSYQKAMRALASKMFVGKGQLIHSDSTEREISRSTSDMENMFSELFAATAQYDVVKLHDVLENFFHRVQKLDGKVSVYNFSLYVISKVEAYLHSVNLNFYQILGMEYQYLDEVFEFETIDDIKSWLRRKLYEISEYIFRQKQKPQNKLIQEIEQYVESHLAENITLRNVAEYFAFSPNYLGYLFKEAKQENFSEYVIERRMNKAKSLLKDARMKIYEVSELVGYKNLAYFSRHFKVRFGMSPGEFRKQGTG